MMDLKTHFFINDTLEYTLELKKTRVLIMFLVQKYFSWDYLILNLIHYILPF